jgi:hypothetical protein
MHEYLNFDGGGTVCSLLIVLYLLYCLTMKRLTNTRLLMELSLGHLFDNKVQMLTVRETVFPDHYEESIKDRWVQLSTTTKYVKKNQRKMFYPVEIISLLYWGIRTKSVIHFGFLEDVSI